MLPRCPQCHRTLKDPKVVRVGVFKRRSDGQTIQRYKCCHCLITFSSATHHACFAQNKRQMNEPLRKLLCSGVSLRRSAFILNLSRTTVTRKLQFLAIQSRLKFQIQNMKLSVIHFQFDDMETFEHSKCKPISITLAVEAKTRFILGFQTARMPAKGHLAQLARKRYGVRADERIAKRKLLFKQLRSNISSNILLIESDQNPHYSPVVKRYFPKAEYKMHKGQRGCVVGQGELKRGGFDPIFSVNHTCAMLRANINRLFRRTWCTTKKIERLHDHISIYVNFHNEMIQEKLKTKNPKAS